jgi:hypothetical protein
MFGGEDPIVVVNRFESVAQLEIGAMEDPLEGRKRRLPGTGLDPGNHRLRYAGTLCKLPLCQGSPSSGKPDEAGCCAGIRRRGHLVMIPQAVS